MNNSENIKRLSQKKQVLHHLQQHGSITTWEAFKLYRITRVAARIYDLKKEGFPISTRLAPSKNGGNHAVYSLEIEADAA